MEEDLRQLRPAVQRFHSLVAEESGEGDLVHFRVGASLPWSGLVSGYRGTLWTPKELRT